MDKADLKNKALHYHRYPRPGKIQVVSSKRLASEADLTLAYSPGVADACLAIAKDKSQAKYLTSRSNLVAVITNGTAVLGLGNIGPLASKPVMEGKAVLFKKFAGIDVFDLEIKENDPKKLVDIIAALEPTFGGINLEDIKAPECFYIEKQLRERMKIPVFHDDQHGTAIIVGAAIQNGLKLLGKKISDIKLVTCGAGAAAIACLDLLVRLGAKKDNIWVCDSKGVIHSDRQDLDASKQRYMRTTPERSLQNVIVNADVFLGLSTVGVLSIDMVKRMAAAPLILALANPDPEILPPVVQAACPTAIIFTGRSDYPNQVNNVLCFPFIFRGALDVGATTITEGMKLAAMHAIAELAHITHSAVNADRGGALHFGANYVIPRLFDPRLIMNIAPAVAKAAMKDKVAAHPITDWDRYTETLSQFVDHASSC